MKDMCVYVYTYICIYRLAGLEHQSVVENSPSSLLLLFSTFMVMSHFFALQSAAESSGSHLNFTQTLMSCLRLVLGWKMKSSEIFSGWMPVSPSL